MGGLNIGAGPPGRGLTIGPPIGPPAGLNVGGCIPGGPPPGGLRFVVACWGGGYLLAPPVASSDIKDLASKSPDLSTLRVSSNLGPCINN